MPLDHPLDTDPGEPTIPGCTRQGPPPTPPPPHGRWLTCDTATMNGALCDCGVIAIGRCSVCQSAFCASHLSRSLFGASADLCAACAARQAELARQVLRSKEDEKRHARDSADENMRRIAACISSLARSGHLVGRYHSYGTSPRFFGKQRFFQCALAPAYPVGDFDWRVAKNSSPIPRPTGAEGSGHLVLMHEERRSDVPLKSCGDPEHHDFLESGFPSNHPQGPSLGQPHASKTPYQLLALVADRLEHATQRMR